MRYFNLLTAIFVFGLIATAQERVPGKTIAVCDLLRQPSTYNGKVISVRGIYFVGGHGLYLKGENCDGTLVTKGYRWPSVIWIVNIEEEMQHHGRSLDEYMMALVAVGEARQRKLLSAPAGSRVKSITVTYTGLFETPENIDARVGRRADGSVVGAGFGQAPGAPGQLFVDSVRDITVVLETPPEPR